MSRRLACCLRIFTNGTVFQIVADAYKCDEQDWDIAQSSKQSLSHWNRDVSLADLIELACLMEATAPKPGNVHPRAAFDDLCYDDFVRASRAVADPLSQARNIGLGPSILNSVRAVHQATGTNVNLGIVLLLAPLVAVPLDQPLLDGLPLVLERTTIADAACAYEAIRIAAPGGMGEAASQDIRNAPSVTLREAMALAADRDRIAEQYVTDYSLVFAARDFLCDQLARSADWRMSIVILGLWMMSKWPDTLIARKGGRPLSEEASVKACAVFADWELNRHEFLQGLVQFDAWLRAEGHRRNPGTTADLIAATLFAALRDGLIKGPTLDEVRRAAAQSINASINSSEITI